MSLPLQEGFSEGGKIMPAMGWMFPVQNSSAAKVMVLRGRLLRSDWAMRTPLSLAYL